MKSKQRFKCVRCGKQTNDVYWSDPITGKRIDRKRESPWCAACYEQVIRIWTRETYTNFCEAEAVKRRIKAHF